MTKQNLSHEPMATANATAATVGVVYIACALAVTLTPDLLTAIARSWFHGIALEPYRGISVPSFVIGFTTAVAGGWLLGFMFAKFYTYFQEKQ